MSGALITALGGGPVDIALVGTPGILAWDFVLAGSDLQIDASLHAAVVLSLFCDRTANADDTLPDNFSDRRGWWGDLPRDGSVLTPSAYSGSRLWLLRRVAATPQTALQAQAFCLEALAWLTGSRDQGSGIGGQAAGPIAQSVTVATRWEAPDRLFINPVIARRAAGQTVNHSYDLYWAAS